MDNNQFKNLVNEVFGWVDSTSKTKGQEYSGRSVERLQNFINGGIEMEDHPLKVLHGYMAKHWTSIRTFVLDVSKDRAPDPKSLSESIEGRYLDLILYSILAIGLIRQTLPDYATRPLSSKEPTTKTPENLEGILPTGPKVAPPIVLGTNEPNRKKSIYDTVREYPVFFPSPTDPVLVKSQGALLPPTGIDKKPNEMDMLQADIAAWAGASFSRRNLNTIRLKMVYSEIPELLVALGSDDWDKADDEMRDLTILFMDHMALRDKSLFEQVKQKHEINMRRKWATDANGVSHHIDSE